MIIERRKVKWKGKVKGEKRNGKGKEAHKKSHFCIFRGIWRVLNKWFWRKIEQRVFLES